MDIDISKIDSVTRMKNLAPNRKIPAQDIKVPKKNEEIARKAEEVKREAMSIKKVEMSYDSNINRVIITVVDSANGKVVQQIPGPDSITFMRRFQQNLKETLNIKV